MWKWMLSLPQSKHITKICSSQWRSVGFMCKTSYFQGFFFEHWWPAFISWFQVLLLSNLLQVSRGPERWMAMPRAHSSAPGPLSQVTFFYSWNSTVFLSIQLWSKQLLTYTHTSSNPCNRRAWNPGCHFWKVIGLWFNPKSFLEFDSQSHQFLNSFFRTPSYLQNS